MPARTVLVLTLGIAASGCDEAPSTALWPLMPQDEQVLVGVACSVSNDGRTHLFATDGQTGIISYGGRALRMVREHPEIPFHPENYDSLAMVSVPDRAVTIEIGPRPGETRTSETSSRVIRPVTFKVREPHRQSSSSSYLDMFMYCEA